MIRLGAFNRPDLAQIEGVREARLQLFKYLRRSPEERAQRRAIIDDRIFNQEIRRAVFDRCHFKCVFCEIPQHGDNYKIVDHFRPLRDARGLEGAPDRDFYSWLAYEFDNLILVCRECLHHKGTSFPVFWGTRTLHRQSLRSSAARGADAARSLLRPS